MTRWATFGCYGTLIDWDAGIGTELERLFGDAGLLDRYHAVEPEVQREDPSRRYREVMALTLERIADVPAAEWDALAVSLPGWPAFPDAPDSLARLRERGWRLAILSNSDRDLIDASIEALGVPFELPTLAALPATLEELVPS